GPVRSASVPWLWAGPASPAPLSGAKPCSPTAKAVCARARAQTALAVGEHGFARPFFVGPLQSHHVLGVRHRLEARDGAPLVSGPRGDGNISGRGPRPLWSGGDDQRRPRVAALGAERCGATGQRDADA